MKMFAIHPTAFHLPPGLVLLPSFVSPEKQRSLVRFSLCEQARHPNETNLDIHYILPNDGLWTEFLRSRQDGGGDPIIQPRSCDSSAIREPPGPRKLIRNTPANPSNFAEISSEPKLSPSPSSASQPALSSDLLKKLRWANIGYFYHWGSKQYDFTKSKGFVHKEYKEVCKNAVASVDWEDVFRGTDASDGWGGDDWRTWNGTYGTHLTCVKCSHLLNLCP